MITSTQNPKVKHVRQLNSLAKIRRKHKAYVIEGTRLLEEAFKTENDPEMVFYTGDLDQRADNLIVRYQERGISTEITDGKVFSTMSDTVTPQGILGVFPMISLPIPSDTNFVLVADNIRDPGNLGTVMRSAGAAGVDALFISVGSVDPYSPKVVRSAMGAHFRLPLKTGTWQDITRSIHDMHIFLADMNQGSSLWDVDLLAPTAIILGGEAHGAGKEAHQLAHEIIHIPMSAGTESLNASAAAAILLFEVVRQRSTQDQQ
jgi:TrmH family RNA methyltransferase